MNLKEIKTFREKVKKMIIEEIKDRKLLDELVGLNMTIVEILSLIKRPKRPLVLEEGR